MSDEARELLKGLIERKVASRLGSGPTGAQELKRSRFFNVYDFNKILMKSYEAEFIPPAATSQTDVRNFDHEFTSEPAAGLFYFFKINFSDHLIVVLRFHGSKSHVRNNAREIQFRRLYF
jgi:hypothetical protein